MSGKEGTFNLHNLLPNFDALGSIPETSDQLSGYFVVFLIGTFIFFVLVSFKALFGARKKIVWLEKILANETSQTVVKNRQNLREQANKVKHNAGHLWKEFDETLIEAEIGGTVHLHNIYDADHFFNTSTLAAGVTESRMLAAVPGFLTAFGVIGTFVGLQLGLSGLHIGNGISVNDMKDGLENVIGGATIAFTTSVWGVFLSVLFNFIEKVLERQARGWIDRVQTRIDELFPRFSAESQLQRIAYDGTQSREALQGLAEQIGQKMQESLLEATAGIQNGLETSLEKIMAPAIDKLVGETTDGNQKALEQLVENFLSRFGEQGEFQRQAMDAASKGVGEALSSMSLTLNGFVNHMEQNLSAMSERERDFVETISNQVNGLVSQSKEHGRVLTEFVETQFMGITKSIESSRQVLEERERKLSDSFHQVIGGVEKSMQNHLSATNKLMEQGEGLQQKVEASVANYKSIAENMQHGAEELRSAAELLHEYGNGVKQSSLQLEGAIFNAAKSTVDLAEENKKTSAYVGQIYKELTSNIEKLHIVVEKLGNVVDTADSTFGHLEVHQKNYLEGLKANVASLAEQMTQLLSDYAERANSQTSDHLGIWAKHTTNYAEQMNSAAQALSGVVDEIEMKLAS